jgi:putative tricarboxylic transport membrane protein
VAEVSAGSDEPSHGYRLATLVAGALLALAGVALAVSSVGLGLVVGAVPAPGFFPTVLGLLLAALGVALVVQALWLRLRQGEDSYLPDLLGWRRLGYTAGATIGLLLVLEPVGYQVAMTLYVFGLLVLAGGRRLLPSAVIAVVFGVGTYVAFVYGLDLALPNASLPLLSRLGL